MDSRNELLNKFYSEVCDEDTRLNAKHRQLEFIITDRYVQKYLKPESRILEVGVGTGKYSAYYENKSMQLTLLNMCNII